MKDFVKQYSKNIYSQNGEDGIIEECLKRLKLETGICAEFGAADGIFCSNTYNLLKQGWKGIMIEYDKDLFEKMDKNMDELNCITHHQAVTPYNINQLLFKELDVLSIDTDSDNDFYCWKAYTGTAKIVIIEINSSKEPMEGYLMEGSSYITMVQLGMNKDYFLLCHTGNLIFVHNDFKSLFPEVCFHPLMDFEEYFNDSWLTL